MSMWELATGPGWPRRFGLTWLSGTVLLAAGVVNAVQTVITVKERPAVPEELRELDLIPRDVVVPVERVGSPLTIDLIDAYEGAPVEVRVTGCSDRPIELVREGAGFPIKLWDVDAHGDCFVQARRKDGLFWTRWTHPVPVGRDLDLAVALPDELAGGVGIRISGTARGAQVHEVEPWTPAWQAGIERGDIVETVDGRVVSGLSTDEMVERITGPAGTSVELGIVDVRSGRRLIRRVERRYME